MGNILEVRNTPETHPTGGHIPCFAIPVREGICEHVSGVPASHGIKYRGVSKETNTNRPVDGLPFQVVVRINVAASSIDVRKDIWQFWWHRIWIWPVIEPVGFFVKLWVCQLVVLQAREEGDFGYFDTPRRFSQIDMY